MRRIRGTVNLGVEVDEPLLLISARGFRAFGGAEINGILASQLR